MRPGFRSKRAWGALLLVVVAGSVLVLSARLSGGRRFEPPTQAAVESLLTETLGLPLRVGAVGFDLWSLALALEDVQIQIASWQLAASRIRLRPDWKALVDGKLRPLAWTDRFELVADASHGAEAAERLPELFEVIGIPDARIRLRGGDLLTRERTLLLGALAFDLEHAQGGAAIRVRARQGSAGRMDARGFVSHEGALVVDAYLDGLSTPRAEPWVARLSTRPPDALGLPQLAASASGRWHLDVGNAGASRHEFALELRTWELPAETTLHRQPVVRLEIGGHLGLEAGSATTIIPGSQVRLAVVAERLRLRGPEGHWLVSGPFQIDLRPFGPWQEPYLVLEAVFDAVHLDLPRGFRKPAGTRGQLALVHGDVPGDPVLTRFRLNLADLDARGEVSREGGLSAASDWLDLARASELLPPLSQRATGGSLRIKSLRAAGPDEFDAVIEFAGAEWAGSRMPFPIAGLQGSVQLKPDSVHARDLLASFADVPVRFELAARRELGQGSPWHLSFQAEADVIDVPAIDAGSAAREVPGSGIALPAELAAIAQQQLPFLRDLGVTTKLEIDRGRFRCARVRARGETLRGVEVDMSLRSLLLDLARVSFERRGVRRSYRGSVDLNPLLPDVHLAALD